MADPSEDLGEVLSWERLPLTGSREFSLTKRKQPMNCTEMEMTSRSKALTWRVPPRGGKRPALHD